MLIAFRVDATPATGNGHLARCLTLADALAAAGARCLFLCRDLPAAAAAQVAARGHALRSLVPAGNTAAPSQGEPAHAHWLSAGHERDAQEVAGILEAERPDWLVVDHYGVDAAWEKRLRPHCRQLMVLDDLADRAHDCDLLLDPGAIAGLEQRYRALVPAACMLMLGPRYALLRPEFDIARAAMPTRKRKVPRRVLVMFGGQDEAGQTLEAIVALRACAGAPELAVDVLIPEMNCRRSEIAQACAADERFRLHVASKEVARLMAAADLAIGSGGGATYERLALQCPSFLTVAAENQRAPLKSLADLGLLTLYEDAAQLQALLRQAFDEGVAPPPATVCNGVPAVVDALLHRLVCLTPVRARDVAHSLRWMQDATLRHEFMLRAAPTRASHFAYWRRLLTDRSQMVYSIFAGQRHIGQAGLRNIERESGRAELWLYLGRAATRGQGFGEAALARLESVIKNELACRTAVLHVGRHNTRAIRLYEKAGYLPTSYDEQAGFVSAEGVLRMEKRCEMRNHATDLSALVGLFQPDRLGRALRLP